MIDSPHHAIPLAWPAGRRRRAPHERREGEFAEKGLSSAMYGVRRIQRGLDRLGHRRRHIFRRRLGRARPG